MADSFHKVKWTRSSWWDSNDSTVMLGSHRLPVEQRQRGSEDRVCMHGRHLAPRYRHLPEITQGEVFFILGSLQPAKWEGVKLLSFCLERKSVGNSKAEAASVPLLHRPCRIFQRMKCSRLCPPGCWGSRIKWF